MSHTDRQLAATINADWDRWTVVLLKPDCVARGLVDPVLTWVSTMVRLVDQRLVRPTEEQIFAHYHDLLGARRDHFTWVDPWWPRCGCCVAAWRLGRSRCGRGRRR
jgi:hypothetical protein